MFRLVTQINFHYPVSASVSVSFSQTCDLASVTEEPIKALNIALQSCTSKKASLQPKVTRNKDYDRADLQSGMGLSRRFHHASF